MPDYSETTTNAVPNPGSMKARMKGCTCPVLDNAHGRGYHGQPNVFVYTAGCPVHARALSAREAKDGE